MIQILLVEDNSLKRQSVERVIADALLHEQHFVSVVENVYSAGQALRRERFDLMILDINVPLRAGEDSRVDGGISLLNQVNNRKEFHVPEHIIGLSAFESLVKEHERLFAQFTWALVHYDIASDEWSRQLTLKLEHIANYRGDAFCDKYGIDLAIITAMERWELTKVKELDAGWERKKVDGDDTFYYVGRFYRDGKNVNVVCAAAIQVGMPASTGLAMKMCAMFKPRYLAMVGIAAGIRGGFGDVLVADKSWDYGSGKSRALDNSDGTIFGGATFEPAPTAIPLDAELVEKVRHFCENKEILRAIEFGWRGQRAATDLAVQIGPVASGASVLENRPLINAIKSHDRKLIGVEMETYGVFLAARICPQPRPKAISFKSICDLGDTDKGDDWQEYAAYTSARFLYEFAIDQLASQS
jgi:nucleoside phosphorylase/CheY-like chemotaxis protein